MTVTVTYDDSLSRVQIAATGLAAADHALVQRSSDQVRWTTVRGAAEWPCAAGTFVRTLDDYEFTPDVPNYYQVSGLVLDTAPTFVAAAASDSGSSGSRTPAAPAGIIAGDTVLIVASTRNSGTGTVNTPANWTQLAANGNLALLGRIYDGSWAMPTVTYTGGAANEDTLARAAAWRGIGIPASTSAPTSPTANSSAQNIAYPAVSVPADDSLVIVAGWKQDDWTSVATLAGMTEVGETSSTAGNDAGQVWDYVLQTTAADIAAGSFAVTGGAAAISRALTVVLPRQAYLNQQTGSATPVLTQHWLKSIARPFLNMPVSLGKRRDLRYVSRGTSLEIINRSDAVEVTDLRASAAFDLVVRTADRAERERLSNLLAGGDVLLLHAPTGSRYTTRYLAVGDVTEGVLGSAEQERWLLPCAQRAAPQSDVVGTTSTCDTILSDFATCADVLAEFATCVEVMEYVADPSDVIVP